MKRDDFAELTLLFFATAAISLLVWYAVVWPPGVR